jgi:thymidine phosphorylase
VSLITASILSKKLSAGLQSLVLDVKVGNGAFMEKSRDAAALASSLVEVANGAGLKTTALLTDMNQPLASAAGNAVEVQNAVDFLTGRADVRLEKVTLALAAEMLASAGLASTSQDALAKAQNALRSGRAAEIFARMVKVLGGPGDFIDKPARYLPKVPIVQEVRAVHGGFVTRVDTRRIGLTVVALGGGRTRPQDPVDHAVGLTGLASIGAAVAGGEPLALVHARDAMAAQQAVSQVLASYVVGETRPATAKEILRRVASV